MSARALTNEPEESFEELYENAPFGYLSTGPGGTIIRVNQTFLTMSGHDRETVLGGIRMQDLLTLPGRIFYDTHFAPLVRIQGFVREIACDIVRPGLEPLPVFVNATQVLDDLGNPKVVRFTIFEATERRRYEADLLAARKRAESYEFIVQSSADAIVSFSPDGIIRTWNPGAEHMFGYSMSEAIGQKAGEIIASPITAELDSILPDLRAGNDVRRISVCSPRNRTPLDASVIITPQIEPPGELTGISAIFRDITERRRIEESRYRQETLQNLIQAQEMERRRMARDIHDHVGQHMTALRLAVARALNEFEEDVEMRGRLERIQEHADRVDRDLSFLAFELRPSVIDELGLASALENLVREWSHHYGLSVSFHGPGPKPLPLTSEAEINLYRITQEALNNIAKHAGATEVSVTLRGGEGRALLVIEDDGVGFDASANLPREDRAGHGFGLLGMRERAAIIGGSIEFESAPGQGTLLFVTAPLAPAAGDTLKAAADG